MSLSMLARDMVPRLSARGPLQRPDSFPSPVLPRSMAGESELDCPPQPVPGCSTASADPGTVGGPQDSTVMKAFGFYIPYFLTEENRNCRREAGVLMRLFPAWPRACRRERSLPGAQPGCDCCNTQPSARCVTPCSTCGSAEMRQAPDASAPLSEAQLTQVARAPCKPLLNTGCFSRSRHL